MSTQSIKEISLERYGYEAEMNLKRLSDCRFAKKHFKIGQEIDRDKVSHYMFIDRIACNNNCKLTNYIDDKIKGQLKKVQNKIKPAISNPTSKETIVSVETPMQWENVQW